MRSAMGLLCVSRHGTLAAAAALAALAGCEQPQAPGIPMAAYPGAAAPPAQVVPVQVAQAQASDLARRGASLDANNADLHTQLAQSQRYATAMREQAAQVRRQLADAEERIRQAEAELGQTRQSRREAEARLASLQTNARPVGVTIVPNSSLQTSLPVLEPAGAEAWRDGDLIRIAFPADSLYAPQSASFQAGAEALLDGAAQIIAQHYPRQIVVVEGHAAAEPLPAGVFASLQALTAAQATAACERLLSRKLPPNQLRVMGQGASQPRVGHSLPDSRRKNARLELVVYPETF